MERCTSTTELIERAGGVTILSTRSQSTRFPITVDAVAKWRKNGIPEVHWPLFLHLEGVTPNVMYAANETLRKSRGAAEEERECA